MITETITVSAQERARLGKLETVIERGLTTFVEVGTALKEIRDSRLYRETHATFEMYLDERWGMSRAHGYRLIDIAQVANAVSPVGDINAAQARELVTFYRREGPKATRDLWCELRGKHERVTGERVRQAVGSNVVRSDPPPYALIREWAVEVRHPTRQLGLALEGAISAVVADPTLAGFGVVEALRLAAQKLLDDAARIERSLSDAGLREAA